MAGRVACGRMRKLTLCGWSATKTRAAGRIAELVAVIRYQPELSVAVFADGA